MWENVQATYWNSIRRTLINTEGNLNHNSNIAASRPTDRQTAPPLNVSATTWEEHQVHEIHRCTELCRFVNRVINLGLKPPFIPVGRSLLLFHCQQSRRTARLGFIHVQLQAGFAFGMRFYDSSVDSSFAWGNIQCKDTGSLSCVNVWGKTTFGGESQGHCTCTYASHHSCGQARTEVHPGGPVTYYNK